MIHCKEVMGEGRELNVGPHVQAQRTLGRNGAGWDKVSERGWEGLFEA